MEPKDNEVKKTIEGNVKTYCEMEDGTWNCNDIAYKYRLEIKEEYRMRPAIQYSYTLAT